MQINAITAAQAAAAGELRSGDEAEDEAELEEDEDVVIHTPIIDEETAARFYLVLPKDEADDREEPSLSGNCQLQLTTNGLPIEDTTLEPPSEKKATG